MASSGATSVEILDRYIKAVLFSSETADSIAAAVVEAVKGGADLRGADLGGAYLGGAYLRGAYLRGAYLRGADLGGAYLGGADLGGAYLGGADLGGADLRGADLGGAYLRGADLGGAYLGGAYLGGAYLGGADLRGADLRGAKGLLPNGITPLQIGGSRDWLTVRTAGYITIGCEHHDVAWWEEHYRAIGRREHYTDEQIAEYAAHIQYAKQWMDRSGVLAPLAAAQGAE